MTGWTPGNSERRRAKRFKVQWTGTLTCLFPTHEETVDVKVVEISVLGARLELKALKIGSHHIVITSESSRFTLKVSLPEAAICEPVKIIWYSTDQEKDSFNVGVMFLQTSEDRRATIQRLLADVSHEAALFVERK